MAGKTLALNEVGYGNFSLAQPLAFDPYRDNRDTGGFILIDRFTNATVGAGMIDFSLMRATNVHWQALDVNKQARAAHEGPEAGGAVVHRPVGLGQVHHRQSGGEERWPPKASTPICWTATMSAMASTAIWASPMPTGWRISAASARPPSCSSMPA